jgi:hypothetical protein
LIAWLNARALRELIGISVSDLAASLYRGGGVAAIAVLATLAGAIPVPPDATSAVRVAVSGASAGFGWLLGIFWLRHPLRDEIAKVVWANIERLKSLTGVP